MTAPDPPRPIASYRADLVTTVLGGWFTVGLFLDAWAHNTKPGLETFFTPWHAVFYSGFTATAAWVLWVCRAALQPGQPSATGIPIGYAPTLVAVFGFAVAGVGDLIWHTVFGVEQSINILFSPTHLALVGTMFVIVTTPVRAAWANSTLDRQAGLVRLLPAVVSTAFATTLVLLFLQYGNVLTFDSERVVGALAGDSGFTFTFVSSLALTGLILIAPLLTLARRWQPPPGTATILYLACGALSTAVTGLDNLPVIAGVILAGVAVDVLIWFLRPDPDRLARFRGLGALGPLLTWTIFIATAYATANPVDVGPGSAHPEGVAELYTGAPIVQSLLGLLVAALLVPGPVSGGRRPAGAPRPSRGGVARSRG